MAFFSYDPAIGRAAMAQMPGVISEAGAVGGGGSPFGKGFGNFLRMWAGNLGDNLTGNPVFAQNIQAQQEMERQQAAYDRKLADEKAWWYEQQDYRAAHEQPELPGLAKEIQWIGGLPEDQRQSAMELIKLLRPGQFVPPTPYVLPHNVRPVSGGGDNIPVVSNEAEAAKLPPGSQFRPYPGGPIKRVPGGPSPSGSGGFPGPY